MNLTGLLSGALLTLMASACLSASSPETEPAWQSIFDGHSLDGWTPKIVGQAAGSDTHQIFRAENGVLRVSYDAYTSFNSDFGHLFYNIPASDYRLRFDYLFSGAQTPGGPAWAFMNSGVMVHAQAPETMALDQAFPICVEAQLLGAAPALPGRTTANICTPGSHIVIDGELVTQHCINSQTLAAPEQVWTRFEIEVRKGEIIALSVNGETAFTLQGPHFDETDPDVVRLGLTGPMESGYFALQAESHPVAFRNIEWQRLDQATSSTR